ncbi:CsiV family protein, partial [Pseudomonadota bacterium]
IRAMLSGNIEIFESQLLFVDVDVTNEFPDEYSGYATPARQDRPPGKYSMREKRRVKLNELHYFDHPFFGLLFRVSRY